MAGFGIPPKGDEIKEIIDERLAQAMRESGAKVTVDWRGEQRHLYVISMPVSMLYFNPDTHRVRAQRELDPVRNKDLEEDPWGEGAQTYLHELLKQRPSNPDQIDPEFTALLDELDDVGQRDPGIVSPDGILVDGNTRAAALRELGIPNIKVGVLPSDTSRGDINAVELSLQLRKDRRRDYTYINRLIAIEEELRRGRSEEDVAKDFNIKRDTLVRDRWVYSLILKVIDRSKSRDGASLRLIDFEQHQEKLRELHRDYFKLAVTDTDAAERLLQSRLALLLLDYPKTSLRLAEEDFYSRYLETRLPEELKPEPEAAEPVTVPGIPGATLPTQSSDLSAVEALTDQLLRAKALTNGSGSTPSDKIARASEVMKTAQGAFDTAVKLAGQNAELVKRRTAVPERLTDAADYVTQCANEFAAAKAKRALDEDAFDDALLVLRESLDRLARQAGRTFEAPGEGVAWLLDAVRIK